MVQIYKSFTTHANFLAYFFDYSLKISTFESNNYTMSLETMIVRDFIDKKVDYLERVEATLSCEGLSTNRRTRLLCDILEKGIAFGISKGGYILKCTQERIEAVKEKAYRNWLEDVIYSINEDIEESMIKNKYKKK